MLLKIEDHDRNGLDGMTGRLEDLQTHARKIERIAILHRNERVFRLSVGAEMDRRAEPVAQFEVTGYEVGVEVGEEDMPNAKAEFLGVGNVLLGIALGIDNNGSGAGLVSEEVRGVGQTLQIVLLEDHKLTSRALAASRPQTNSTPHGS